MGAGGGGGIGYIPPGHHGFLVAHLLRRRAARQASQALTADLTERGIIPETRKRNVWLQIIGYSALFIGFSGIVFIVVLLSR
jgi:hypothetical protein